MPFIGLAWSFISGGFGKLLLFAARLPWYVWVAAVILFIGWRVHSGMESRAHDAAYNEGWSQQHAVVVQEQAANKKNMLAIGQLEAIIRAKNSESDARAAAFAQSRLQDMAAVKAADARQKADMGRQSRLQGIADHARANPTCKAPAALLANAEGL